MKKTINRSILITICLVSLLLCSCETQQQENRDTKEEQKSEEKVTQGLVMEGRTDDGATYRYNKVTATLTVSGKIINGVDMNYWEEKDEIPWGRWREDAKKLVLEEGVECVTGSAFREFRNLKKIVFPDTLKKIGSYAFFDSLREIKKLELPDSIEEIGDCAFALNLSSDKGFEKIRLPKKLRRIGELAFSSQLLTSITIPENVKSIGDEAFEGCYYLETVTVKSKKIKKAGGSVFLHTNDELAIYVPKEKEKKYRRMLGGTDGHVYPDGNRRYKSK
ncbi:MAG: leucine-rich repeat domain-containing protein [Eubacterium sp.]|nr:leucine-rich repeat domain-containing protein [Eubacterium sp.]